MDCDGHRDEEGQCDVVEGARERASGGGSDSQDRGEDAVRGAAASCADDVGNGGAQRGLLDAQRDAPQQRPCDSGEQHVSEREGRHCSSNDGEHNEHSRAEPVVGAVRILDSEWLTRRINTTPLDLANYCLKFMDANDRIFVTEVPANFAFRSLMADPKAA